MAELIARINQLPQVLQDYIAMYNVTHRRLLAPALLSINNLCFKCDFCDNQYNMYKRDALYNDILGTRFCYCSDYCEFNHGHEYRRKYYKTIRTRTIH